MLQLYKNIKSRRIELGMTQSDLAKKMGYADKSMIAKIEKGLIDLPQTKILSFAELLDVSAGQLMGLDGVLNNTPSSSKKGFPIKILGRVAAGIPIEAITDIIGMEEITEDLAKTGEFFGLKIKGDSMSPDICNNDVVIVRQQPDAENGEIVIATVNGDEAMCKRLRKYKDGIELMSINPGYNSYEFSNKEILEKPVTIIGKVVESRRKF